mmetsp:Transcript_3548/g.3695  ORF Transcript_3548/g.3695 Transcript_3548/m.3695 type:complete len:364 (-) Transcript_3548:395-1486(-)
MIMIVILFTSGCFYLKYYLVRVLNYPNGDVVAEVVNALQILILAYIYSNIAKKLTENENCRTDTEFKDSLIVKLFAFNFVNSNAPSLYIAFIKRASGDPCIDDSCMGELAQQLFIVFISQFMIGIVVQSILPRIKIYFRARDEAKGSNLKGRTFSTIENEYMMDEYDRVDSIQDYKYIVLQFGFLTLFVAAVPFAPFLAMIINYLEIRVDGWKLLTEFRRPNPIGCEDIGTWLHIFRIVSVFAVFTNAGLVFYTAAYFDHFPGFIRLAIALVSISVTFILRYLVSKVFFGKRGEIHTQNRRREFIIDKLIKRVADEEHDDKDEGGEGVATQNKQGKKEDVIWVDDRDNDARGGMTATVPKKNM